MIQCDFCFVLFLSEDCVEKNGENYCSECAREIGLHETAPEKDLCFEPTNRIRTRKGFQKKC